MLVNQVSLTGIMLNISAPDSIPLVLNKSEVVKGTVQSIKQNGMVVLSLKGGTVGAVSEVLVKPGQELYLMVEEIKGGKVYLKVLNSQSLVELEEKSLSAKLIDIGITANKENIIIVRELLRHNMPVTPADFIDVRKGASFLGGLNEQNIRTAVFALVAGISLNKQNLDILAQYMQGNSNPADLMESILRALVDLARSGKDSGFSYKQLSDIGRNPAGNEQLIQELRLDSSYAGSAQTKSGLGIGSASADPKTLAAANSSINQIIFLLEEMQVNLQDTGHNIGVKLQNLLRWEKDLLKGLMLVREIMDRDMDVLRGPIGRDLLEKLDILEKELSGQKMFNFIARTAEERDFNYYYFSFPVKVQEKCCLCSLRINKDGKKRLNDQEKIKFIVSLDTAHLGMVLFYVEWNRNKELKIEGVVENGEVRDYFSNNIERLLQGLAAMGYSVVNLGIKTARTREEFKNFKISPKEDSDKARIWGIDVIV